MRLKECYNRPIHFGCPYRYGRHLCRCFTIYGRLQLCLPGFRVRRASSLSYLNVLPRLETVVQMPIMEGVSLLSFHIVVYLLQQSYRNSHETIFLPIPLFTETGEIHNKLSRA